REDDALSYVRDAQGIYYDASAPSDIEVFTMDKLTPEQLSRTEAIMADWRTLRLSKFNSARDYYGDLPDQYVLVVDQVVGDLSIRYGQANRFSFARMLDAALSENPKATVIVKVHPDSLTRGKKGHYNLKALALIDRIEIIAENCHPTRLLEQAEAVYTVTSQLGFEALIWGTKVHCFGVPFYAGWGLTSDRSPTPKRRRKETLEQLVYSALVRYTKYIDPERKHPCEIEEIMTHIGLQRVMHERFPREILALGFSRWKRQILRSFLKGTHIKFIRYEGQVKEGDAVVLWGNRELKCKNKQINILRIEDGFLRSSGLGADLIRPISWVIDGKGIYYDPKKTSGLQHILSTHNFDASVLARAKRLRERILDAGVSKYNMPGSIWSRPILDRKIVLVPGQVEDDASIRAGCLDVKTNLDLLRSVREAEPTAYIVYKPHPDVQAGLRRSDMDGESISPLCDEIVSDTDVAQLLGQVDELHTMTSLTGFEALLRNIPVTCYGHPFYAGWGLTTDTGIVSGRDRLLQLDELVAGTLVLYPTYISRNTGCFCTPEHALEELIVWRNIGIRKPPFRGKAKRFFLRLWRSLVEIRKIYNDR
ncbi:MAG: hypothetical protein V7727_19860, partial [Sneathiella sp.]